MENNKHSKKYNDFVKKKLRDWLTQFNADGFELNYKAIATNMKNVYHLATSEQKIRQMFIESDREIKLGELVALTHMLNIPLSNFCEFPNTPAVTLERPWNYTKDKERSGISSFDDAHYNNRYYAYYFKPKHFDRLELGGKNPVNGSAIEEAVIEIEKRNTETYVILKENTVTKDFYNKRTLDQFVLEGKLYLLENSQLAYSFITDSAGRRAIALMFEYKSFSKDILYYRTAAMLTLSLNETHTPLFQKIALFPIKQNLSDNINEDILRGILSLNTGPIMVEKDVFDNAVDRHLYPEYKLGELEPKEEKTYYIFSEPAIRDSIHNWTADESVKLLLKLREMSIFQSHEIVKETEYFHTFIKHYQQTHENYPHEHSDDF